MMKAAASVGIDDIMCSQSLYISVSSCAYDFGALGSGFLLPVRHHRYTADFEFSSSSPWPATLFGTSLGLHSALKCVVPLALSFSGTVDLIHPPDYMIMDS
ncbi:hypothetical protein Nepgr_013532 [Nepenthes gracilis]|uniref:Uncharacterized protein n=1 Tax=Nepenthes gracilis TaxID=150966 RepID=A0AAD3SJA2_NEPGR|nr:hypothetical protein Nepgr_013532 [Nepenthes gracilis]